MVLLQVLRGMPNRLQSNKKMNVLSLLFVCFFRKDLLESTGDSRVRLKPSHSPGGRRGNSFLSFLPGILNNGQKALLSVPRGSKGILFCSCFPKQFPVNIYKAGFTSIRFQANPKSRSNNIRRHTLNAEVLRPREK